MLTFFIVMINISNVVSIVTCLIFLIGVSTGSRVLADADIHGRCHQQVGTCKSASFLFMVLFWLIASCMPTEECMNKYVMLSDVSKLYGYIWVIVGFCAIITGISSNIKKKGKDAAIIVSKIKRSCFFMGILFLTISFILKVK